MTTDDEYLAIIREHTTPAEYEVLLLHAGGYTNADGADLLGITRSAYKRRYQRAYRRIDRRRIPRRVPESGLG